MDNQQHIHEWIDQYLNGELVGQELDKFKIRLKDDPDFLRQVQVQKAIIQEIEAQRSAELKAMLAARTKRSSGLIIPFGRKPMAIAAIILSVLALGLLLKINMPFSPNDLAENTEEAPPPVEEIPSDEPQKTDETEQMVVDDSLTIEGNAEMPEEPAPEIAVVDDDVEMEAADESDVLLSEDEVDESISTMREKESKLDGSNVKPTRDSMIGAKMITVTSYSMPAVRKDQVDVVVPSNEDDEKKGIFKRKSKTEQTTAKEVQSNNDGIDEMIKTPKGSIRVEYWVSIVNFKGYKFDGKKLLLFDTPTTASVALKEYNQQTYLVKNGSYYLLVPNSAFNQLRKVSDEATLNILNK